MKVRCPGCGKEYPRPSLPPGQSVAVRCRACGSMFRISPPEEAPAAPAPPSAPGAGGAPAEGKASQSGGGVVFRLRGHSAPQLGAQVLIADEARPFRDMLVQALQSLGASCAVVDDGESALRYVQEQLPRLLLVNVYLRRLLGIIVCERVKADPLLSSTRVVLIGALFRRDRFIREPDRLYGADDYIEEGLTQEEVQQRLGAMLGPAAAAPAPALSAASAASAASGAATGSPATPPIPDELQRLIRIILSDITLYNAERAERAMQSGRFVSEFRAEIEEGLHLIQQRFPILPQAAEMYRRAVQHWVAERGSVLAT